MDAAGELPVPLVDGEDDPGMETHGSTTGTRGNDVGQHGETVITNVK